MKKNRRHHTIPRSRKGTDVGIIMLKKKTHDNYHALFQNDLPHEAMYHVMELDLAVFSEKAKKDIVDLIESLLQDGELYREECLSQPIRLARKPLF